MAADNRQPWIRYRASDVGSCRYQWASKISAGAQGISLTRAICRALTGDLWTSGRLQPGGRERRSSRCGAVEPALAELIGKIAQTGNPPSGKPKVGAEVRDGF